MERGLFTENDRGLLVAFALTGETLAVKRAVGVEISGEKECEHLRMREKEEKRS